MQTRRSPFPLKRAPGHSLDSHRKPRPLSPNSVPLVVRVVVPVNCESRVTVTRCVSALLRSSSAARMEIVVADDTEHDEWQAFARQIGVKWVRTGAHGSAGLARNSGARHFDGEILVFVDADVEVESEAIELLTQPILSGTAEATVGTYTDRVGGMSFASTYKHIYLATVYGRRKGCLKNEFWTGLGAVRRDVFHRLGGFARGFAGASGEDTELGFRMTAAGMRTLAVNAARATHLKAFTLRGLLINDFRKGSMSAGLLLGKRVPLTDFRHCSRRDIVAVAAGALLTAWLFLCATILLPAGLSAAGLALIGVLYLGLREDLVRAFYRHSALFLTGAIPLMWILDQVRALTMLRAVASLTKVDCGRIFRPAGCGATPPLPQKHPTV